MTGTGAAFTVDLPIGPRAGRRGPTGGASPTVTAAPPPVPIEPGRVPRVSRLMALAIRMRRFVDEGVVRDYSDLARLGGVSIPRMTQIMSLLLLAPEIQEEVLFLPRVLAGRDGITERQLREIARVADWEAQRRAWARGLARKLPR